MRKRKQGKVILNGVSPEKHEMDIIVVFTEAGYDVELIPTDRFHGKKTADAIIDGREWEFKTIRGNTTRTVERILKKAYKQSANVVIDISHLKLPEDNTLRKIKHEFAIRNRRIKNIKVITKTRKIIDL